MVTINIKTIQSFMDDKNLNEPDMARIMGIDNSYLFRVLRGERKAGRKFIEGLINAGMKPEAIFSTQPMTNVNSPTGTEGR